MLEPDDDVNNTFPGLCWAWGPNPNIEDVDVAIVGDGDEEEGAEAATETGGVWTVRIEGCGWVCAGWAAGSIDPPNTVMPSPGWHGAMAVDPLLPLLGMPPDCCNVCKLTAGLRLSTDREFCIGMPWMTVCTWPVTGWACVCVCARDTGIWNSVGWPIWPGWSWMCPERIWAAPGWPCEANIWLRLMFWLAVNIWLAIICPPGPWLVMMWPPGCWVRIWPPAWSPGNRNWWFWLCRTVLRGNDNAALLV